MMMGSNDNQHQHNNMSNINSIPLLEAAQEDEQVRISESTYYTQMIHDEELKSADLMSLNSTLPDAKPINPKETKKERLSRYWATFRRWTFGNRRFKSYLLTIAKFFSIIYIQANNLFELDKSKADGNLTKSIEIISYCFMAIILLSFTVRYIREVYCAWKQKPLNIVVNCVEAGIFFLYLAFSTVTAILHLVFIARANYESTKIGLSVFAVLINYYIILEKAWIYFKVSRLSVSLYLAKGTLIPNPNSKHHKK